MLVSFFLEKLRFVNTALTKFSDLSETASIFKRFFPLKFNRRSIFSENNYSLELNMEPMMKHPNPMSWSGSEDNGCFYFQEKATTHVTEDGRVVEKIVTTFQKKKRHGMRVMHPVDAWVLTWLRLTTKRSKCVECVNWVFLEKSRCLELW